MSSSDSSPRGPSRVRVSILTLLVALAFAALAGTSLTWLGYQGLMIFQAPDKFAYDWRHALLSKREPTSRSDLALVMVADETLWAYPFQQPINRRLLASLVRALDQAGAKAIGIDLIFDRPTNPEHDQELINAIKSARTPIVMGALDYRDEENTGKIDLTFQRGFFEAAGVRIDGDRVGHVYFYNKKSRLDNLDQTVRFVAPKSNKTGDLRNSFAEALVATSGLPLHPIGEGGNIAWLQRTAADGSLAISEMIIPTQHRNPTPDEILPASLRRSLKDRIVIVGGIFPDRDRHLIPPSIADGRRVPGVWIHANIAAQLIDGRKLEKLSYYQEVLIVALVAFIAFVAGRYYRVKKYEVLVYVGGAVLLALIGMWLFWARGIILPSDTIFFAGLAGITIGHYSGWIARRLPFHGTA